MFYNLSQRRRALIVGAGALSVVIVIAALVISRREAGSRSGVPIVVVPGYGGDASTVKALVEHLGGTGRRVLAMTLPQRGTGDIGRSAQAVARAVAGLDVRRVDLVGFSAGGIVVRDFIQLHGGAAVARNVVLLGAPNHGTEITASALGIDPSLCSGACAQLVPGSSFLRDLNSGDTTPGDATYISIWTTLDQTVTPPSSALLRGADNVRLQEVCPHSRVSHGELVTDSLPVRLVLQAVHGMIKPSRLDC